MQKNKLMKNILNVLALGAITLVALVGCDDKKSSNGISKYYLTLGERTIKNSSNKVVTPGYRFDRDIYLLRIKKGTKRTRRRINISDDKKSFVLVETVKK